MIAPGVSLPVKEPLPLGSVQVPFGFQGQASTWSSVFWRYVTGYQPEASTCSRAGSVNSLSMGSAGVRSMPAPSAWFGMKLLVEWLRA
jgi:hypothetical protein